MEVTKPYRVWSDETLKYRPYFWRALGLDHFRLAGYQSVALRSRYFVFDKMGRPLPSASPRSREPAAGHRPVLSTGTARHVTQWRILSETLSGGNANEHARASGAKRGAAHVAAGAIHTRGLRFIYVSLSA